MDTGCIEDGPIYYYYPGMWKKIGEDAYEMIQTVFPTYSAADDGRRMIFGRLKPMTDEDVSQPYRVTRRVTENGNVYDFVVPI